MLAYDLKIEIVQTIGHLHALWYTVLEQQENGDLSDWPDTLIAQAALWSGDPTEFVSHLREREWLDGHLVHDWIDYVGPFLIKKYSTGNVSRLKEIWKVHGYKYGKGNGKYTKQKASHKRVVSDTEATIDLIRSDLISSDLISGDEIRKDKEEETASGCDVLKVIETWNAIPGVIKMQKAEGAVMQRIKSRLREHPSFEWWDVLFAKVMASDFLTGKKTDFSASLDWILGPKNMAKLFAGNYDNRTVQPRQAKPKSLVELL